MLEPTAHASSGAPAQMPKSERVAPFGDGDQTLPFQCRIVVPEVAQASLGPVPLTRQMAVEMPLGTADHELPSQ